MHRDCFYRHGFSYGSGEFEYKPDGLSRLCPGSPFPVPQFVDLPTAKMKSLGVSSLLLAASSVAYAQQIAYGQCTLPVSIENKSKIIQF